MSMNTQNGKTMIKELFSEEHIKSVGIEIVGTYMGCSNDQGAIINDFSL